MLLARWLRGILAAAALPGLAGCISVPSERFEGAVAAPAPPGPDLHLDVGDVLEFYFHKSWAPDGPYRLDIGDRIESNVRDRPELDHTAVVLPDGSATFPLLTPVPVQGRTVQEVKDRLEREYRRYLDRPQVSVLVKRPMARVDEFLTRFEDAAAAYRVVLGVDGHADLPLIGPVRAVGRSLSELRTEIQARYVEAMPRVDVTVSLAERPNRAISVLGEVNVGGVFASRIPVTPLRALAMAGGMTDRAHRKQVIHVRPQRDGALEVRVLDLEKFVDGEDLSVLATAVRPNDILYVPRSPISDVNIWVDQHLRQMIPINIGAGFAFTVP